LRQHSQEWLCHKCSEQAVKAGAEEFEEAEIAEDLELLADFVADVELILQPNWA
jgi:hypothetical protein